MSLGNSPEHLTNAVNEGTFPLAPTRRHRSGYHIIFEYEQLSLSPEAPFDPAMVNEMAALP
jgi:hypothetical protein